MSNISLYSSIPLTPYSNFLKYREPSKKKKKKKKTKKKKKKKKKSKYRESPPKIHKYWGSCWE
jgi:hypothetical protein